MKQPENYAFTRAKIRAERIERGKVNARTLACILIPAALGSLMHVGWAIGLAAVGFAVDAVCLRKSA